MANPVGILGKKIGMTQIFENGARIPVTVVQAGPCKVLQVKTQTVDELPDEPVRADVSLDDITKNDPNLPPYRTRYHKKTGKPETRTRKPDGYYAVQLGFDPRKAKTTKKPMRVHVAKATGQAGGMYFIRELRAESTPDSKIGDDWTVAVMEGVEYVDVVGTSKGKGFAGAMKRWGFHGQRASHGNEKKHRAMGGIGRTYSVNKGVPKGKKMPGHMGNRRITAQNVKVVKIDTERNLMLLKGTIPGPNNGYLVIRKARKKS